MQNKIEEYALWILKETFSGQSEKAGNMRCDWEAVRMELEAHTVLALTTEQVLLYKDVPDKIKKEWKESTLKKVCQWYQMMENQRRVLRILQCKGIVPVVLKGAAAASLYPIPEYREMGDIDLYIQEEWVENAICILQKAGYQVIPARKGDDFLHVQLSGNGTRIELHKRIFCLSDDKQSDYLNEMMISGMNKIEYHTVGGYLIPMLPVLENGLVLLVHLLKHLKDGVGLRQVIDWMMYVEQYVDDMFWNEKLEPILLKLKLVPVTKTVTRMCQIYLGLGTETITWCSDTRADYCRELMEYIMHQGNFGRKVSKQHSDFLLNNRNPVVLIRNLQRDGLRHWKLAGYPGLHLFAWCYELSRYVRKGLRMKFSFSELHRSVTKSNEKKQLLSQLDVYDFLYRKRNG